MATALLKRHLSSVASAGLRRKPITGSISAFLGEDPVSKSALKRIEIEKNMVPRCAVMHLLAKKGIWDGRTPKLHSVFSITEKNFKERFVDRYVKDLPKLKEAYQGKVSSADFELIEKSK